jgi:hypothetical protein
MPLLGSMGGDTTSSQINVYADEPGDGSSITFKLEVNGTVDEALTDTVPLSTFTPWALASNYLAWDGSKYNVYTATADATSVGLDTIAAYYADAGKWNISLSRTTIRFKQVNGVVKEYSYNDIVGGSNPKPAFITNAMPTVLDETSTYADSGSVPAVLTTSAESAEVETTSVAVVPDNPVSGLTLLTNVDRRNNGGDYGFDSLDARLKALGDFPQNITEVTFVVSTSFNVYEQIDNDTRIPVKTYTDTAFAALSTNETTAGFLHYKEGEWVVNGTDKYVKIQDLVNDAGLVFNEGDALLIRSSDMFSYQASYETIQTERYFFGGITESLVSTANPTEVGAVIAVYDNDVEKVCHYNSASLTTSADYTLGELSLPNTGAAGNMKNKRFFIGLSAANATTKTAAGNRFPQSVTEVTVIKDKADTVDNAVVTIEKDTYAYTGAKIEPVVTSVTLDGVALVSGTDYTVSYGTNTAAGTGTVTVTGESLPGETTKEFTITPITIADADVTLASTSVVETGAQIKPAVTVKSGSTTLAATDYDVTYGANVAVGEGSVTVAGKGNYAGTVTKKFTITVDQAKLDKEAADKAKADKEKADKEKADKAKAVAAAQTKAEKAVKSLVPPAKNTTVKVAKKAVTVKIKAVKGATKYTIRYKVKGTKKWKTQTITVKQAKAGYKIKSLKKGKKYEIQYSVTKKAGAAKKSVASKWSKSKVTAKVK